MNLNNKKFIIGMFVVLGIAAATGIVYAIIENIPKMASSSNTTSSYSSSYSSKSTEAPKKKVYGVGEMYYKDGLKITIKRIEEETYESYDGKKINLIAAFVKVTNDSDESVSVMQANFDCYVNNKAVDFSYYGKKEGLGIEHISPGRYKEGYLYIEATKNDDIELEYSPSFVRYNDDDVVIFKLT